MPGMLDPYYYSRMRANMPNAYPMHAIVGPLEHREFARDYVKAGGLPAAASVGTAIPIYTLLKALGLLKTRSPASLDEMFAGYEGMFSGLRDRTLDKTNSPTLTKDRQSGYNRE